MTSTTRTAPSANSPSRLLGYVFGAVYTLVGILGFVVTGSTGFAATHGGMLLGIFMVNPLHNIIHIAIGLGLLAAAARGNLTARAANSTVGAVYLLVGILGLFALDASWNILAINGADNVLHFLSAVVLLGVGVIDQRRVTA